MRIPRLGAWLATLALLSGCTELPPWNGFESEEDVTAVPALRGLGGPYDFDLSGEHAVSGASCLRIHVPTDAYGRANQTYIGSWSLNLDQPRDWSAYEGVRAHVFNAKEEFLQFKFYALDPGSTGDYKTCIYQRVLVMPGANDIYLQLAGRKIYDQSRDFDISQVSGFFIELWVLRREGVAAAGSTERDYLFLDDVRLVTAEEVAANPPRLPPAVDSAQLAEARGVAQAAHEALKSAIADAEKAGIDTHYVGASEVTARVGFIRAQMPWLRTREGALLEMYDYIAQSCSAAAQRLAEVVTGTRPEREVPEAVPAERMELRDSYLRDRESGRPTIPFNWYKWQASEQFHGWKYPRWGDSFVPHDYWTYSYATVGIHMWRPDRCPLGEELKAIPGWHRVTPTGDLGRFPICISNPEVGKVVERLLPLDAADSIARYANWGPGTDIRILVLGGEFTYRCFCELCKAEFRKFLRERHGTIQAANERWGTQYGSFEEVGFPDLSDREVELRMWQASRGLYYDYCCWNSGRVAEHFGRCTRWAKQVNPGIATCAGQAASAFSPAIGRNGWDAELYAGTDTVDVTDDEGTVSTLVTHLMWTLGDRLKPVLAWEYHGPKEWMMAHVLHGDCGVEAWINTPMDELWYDDDTGRITASASSILKSLLHSPYIPLCLVEDVVKTALDLRRIPEEVAALTRAPAEVAILYSRSSLFQPPEQGFVRHSTTPYLLELMSVSAGLRHVDARNDFIGEDQIERGKLQSHPYKVLVVPRATYMRPRIAERLLDFAGRGGNLVLISDALTRDEYARPLAALASAGIEIEGLAGEEAELGEGFSGARESTYVSFLERETPRALRLESRDLFAAGQPSLQAVGPELRVSCPGAAVLASFPEGSCGSRTARGPST